MDKHGVHGRCEGLLLLGSIHMIHTPKFLFLNSMSLYGNEWRMRKMFNRVVVFFHVLLTIH